LLAAPFIFERVQHMRSHTRVSASSSRLALVSVFFLVLVLIVTSGLRGLAAAQDGQLDPTFGTGGKVRTRVGNAFALLMALAPQRDGKIVAAGMSRSGSTLPDVAVARYNGDGTLDASFGIGGIVTTDLEGGSDDRVAAVVIQPDGKIVVAGTAVTGTFPQQQFTDFGVVRYLTNGTLDRTFGVNGKVFTNSGDKTIGTVGAVALQSDGKIVIGGRRLLTFSTSDFLLVRYNTNGSLDASFGDGGKLIQDPSPGGANKLTALAVQTDGRIIAAGTFARNEEDSADIGLVRFMSDGALDASFGIGGIVTTDISGTNDGANAMALQRDGKIVVAGFANSGESRLFALARYAADGTLDGKFGINGIVTTSFAGVDPQNADPNGVVFDEAFAVKIQPDGKIVAAGQHFAPDLPDSNEEFALVRYQKNGSFDPSFGHDGRVTTDFTGGSEDFATSLVIQADGKIVLGGSVFPTDNTPPGFGLARYLSGAYGPSTF
jgi:uncharacterized delta-60 repeat protein